jgi:hypothetical protein
MRRFPVSRLNGISDTAPSFHLSDDGNRRGHGPGKAHPAKDSGAAPPASLDFMPENDWSKIQEFAVFS